VKSFCEFKQEVWAFNYFVKRKLFKTHRYNKHNTIIINGGRMPHDGINFYEKLHFTADKVLPNYNCVYFNYIKKKIGEI